MEIKARKPVAERIDCSGRREVIYACPSCSMSFARLGNRIKYCYDCGTKINWDVLTYLDKTIESICNESGSGMSIDEFEKSFVENLNITQLGEEFTKLYHEDKSPKSCEECKFAVGTEGCKIDDKKKTIIFIPKRAGYCRSAICDHYLDKGV